MFIQKKTEHPEKLTPIEIAIIEEATITLA
jgi:hypothetical protein